MTDETDKLVGAVNTLAQLAGENPSMLDTYLGLIDLTIDTQLPHIPENQRAAFDTTFRREAKAQAVAKTQEPKLAT